MVSSDGVQPKDGGQEISDNGGPTADQGHRPTIRIFGVSPSSAAVGSPAAPVRFLASLTRPDRSITRLTLEQVDAEGRAIQRLTELRDDGAGADYRANDNVFVGEVSLDRRVERTVRARARVVHLGKEVRSNTKNFYVTLFPTDWSGNNCGPWVIDPTACSEVCSENLSVGFDLAMTPQQRVRQIVAEAGGTVVHVIFSLGAFLIHIPGDGTFGMIDAAAQRYRNFSEVRYANPDARGYLPERPVYGNICLPSRATRFQQPSQCDADADGTLDCVDRCPDDPAKTEPGACGCGSPDKDENSDGRADCCAAGQTPGACGCGVAATDGDGDHVPDCTDRCPQDASKSLPGQCGCGQSDTDSDGDGYADCRDDCPHNPDKSEWFYIGSGTRDCS